MGFGKMLEHLKPIGKLIWIYTKNEIQPPQFLGPDSNVETCILGDGVEIEGQVYNSVIGSNVMIGKNTIIRDSIIMSSTIIKDNAVIERSIISEGCIIDENVVMGVGDNTINVEFPKIYWSGLTVIGERTYIPEGIKIGKNCSLYGNFTKEEFTDGILESGTNLLAKGGEL
jgi:glucose-1-phosphate adenylyltransferase